MEPAANIDARAMLPVRLPRGFVLGGYVVDGWLRDGGMASIYRARRSRDDQRVALKLQLPSTAQDPMICARFDREAEVMRRARNNPHVVELYDAGVLADGRRYIAMEWVEGENLEDLLDFLRNQDQRLAIARACRIGRDVARGLSELHEHGVLHLDLKPANVMVGHGADGRDEIKLVDFGVAADLHEMETGPHVAPVMGTSGYMAPEQLHGEAPNPTLDVYALGVLMFESLAGTSVPPDGWTPETLPRIETRRREIPAPLADLVHACMDFEPARRPASPREVASELVRIILALESEGRRNGRSTRASVGPARTGVTQRVRHLAAAPAELVRTGGTDVVPRSEVPTEVPARTGGTEVVPIEELVARSVNGGLADVASAGGEEREAALAENEAPQEDVVEPVHAVDAVDPAGSDCSLVPEDAVVAEGVEPPSGEATPSASTSASLQQPVEPDELGAGALEAWDDEDVPRRRGWVRWAVLGAAAAVVAATWIGWGGRSGGDSDSTAAREPVDGTVLASEAARTSEAAGAARERQGSPRTISALEGEDVARERAPLERGASEAADERRAATVLDAEACKRVRASAEEAMHARNWSKVLRVTKQRACWKGNEHGLARRRLRVQAYAERGEFHACVREAGESTDVEIAPRVTYCMNGLRSG